MSTFFAPAIAVMNRLKYPRKFMLIGAVLIIPIAIMAYLLIGGLNADIEFAEKEQIGAEYNNSVKNILKNVQQHRGMAAVYLGGDASFKDKMVAKQAEIRDAISKLDELDGKYGSTLKTTQQWNDLKSQWKHIEDNVLTMQAKESFDLHTALNSDILTFIVYVADISNLTLDPELGSFYLMDGVVNQLPLLTEQLGKLRATGAGAAAKKQLTNEQRVTVVSLTGSAKEILEKTVRGLKVAIQEVPDQKAKLEPLLVKVETATNDFLNLTESDILAPSIITIPSAEYFDNATQTIDTTIVLYEAETQALTEVLQERVDQLNTNRNLIVIVIMVVLLLAVYLFIAFYMSVIRAISSLETTANTMSEGDLTVRANLDARDELMSIGNAFNQMGENLQAVIGKVALNAEQVSAASQQISASTEEIASGSNSQAVTSQTMSELFKELSAAIQSVAQSSEIAAELSDKTVEIAQEGGKAVNLSIDGMNEVNGKMSLLSEDSNKIGDIIEVIDEIAEQTNLLALNAAIEAARAGEHGRGFAVVADEVRKLAERSGEATKQISSIIKGMQENMRQSVSAVSDGVQKTQQTSEAFSNIVNMVNETAKKVTEIAAASEQQAAQSSEVMQSIESIAATSEEAAAASQETASTSQSLAQLAEDLNQSVSIFKVK